MCIENNISNKDFVYLHNHSAKGSNLRLLDSINKIEDMILYCNELGTTAMALTDHEAVCGHIDFLNITKKLKEQNKINPNFKPILGNEIYLVDEEQMRYEMKELGRTTFYHFILLAKDNIGHEQIRELSSKAWIREFNYKGIERVPTFYTDIEDVIGKNKGHLIFSTACLGGQLPHLILALLQTDNEQQKELIKDKIDDFINWCVSMCDKGDFYIELQPSLQEEQIAVNKMAIKIAKAYGLKWIISTDSHYLKEEDRPIHAAYLTSDKDGNGNREVDAFYSTTYFLTVEKIISNMGYLPKEDIINGIITTKEIEDKIIGYNFDKVQKIPLTPIPNKKNWYKNDNLYNIAKRYKYINEMITNNESYDKYMINMALSKIPEKIVKEDYKETFERIDLECQQILGVSKVRKQPISAYFTTMKKNIDIIWEKAESLIMPGRGSAGAYMINFLLGITQLNPLKQGVELPYFRFIHQSKPEMPDCA